MSRRYILFALTFCCQLSWAEGSLDVVLEERDKDVYQILYSSGRSCVVTQFEDARFNRMLDSPCKESYIGTLILHDCIRLGFNTYRSFSSTLIWDCGADGEADEIIFSNSDTKVDHKKYYEGILSETADAIKAGEAF